MSQHLQRDLDSLKERLLGLSILVEEAIDRAIQALGNRRADLAGEVRLGDSEIDRIEVEIEEECLKILALHQPVAGDLRFVVAALKVNNDLERMGDLAVNIAKRAEYLAKRDALAVPESFPEMAGKVNRMVRESLQSVVRADTSLARKVLQADDEIDTTHTEMYRTIRHLMEEDPACIKRALHLLSASRYLERIADLSTNIAEDLIFMVDGEVIRHGMDRIIDNAGD